MNQATGNAGNASRAVADLGRRLTWTARLIGRAALRRLELRQKQAQKARFLKRFAAKLP